MARCLLVIATLAALLAVTYAAPKQEDSGRVLGLPTIPLPFPLPPFPGLGLIPTQQRFGKPGLCPYVRRLVPPGINTASVCGNLCLEDSHCPLTQKCCAHECGYSCFNPVRIVA